mmetsp:Transcript_2045/g.4626  ORF Transcript_2045/g.4626 Transcript_2045/m.4626 type:complete len:442 (+) Transcript_2045:90-1415(+)
MNRSRSRSPLRIAAPSLEVRETVLAEFARHYWAPPDEEGAPPWIGKRASEVMRFRERMVAQAEVAVKGLDPDFGELRLAKCSQPFKDLVVRWQRFTFYEDVARMSDVLFRGPIEPYHADSIDIRLHQAWRSLRTANQNLQEITAAVTEFRVSAVRVAMLLETARPPEADAFDSLFELPDARTLASLLTLRCEKDDMKELLEVYRLVCQKLVGMTCTWCGKPFDEHSTAGLFDSGENLLVPATVPMLFVPQCGHAVHTVCFGPQLIPDQKDCGVRGRCRRCGLTYAWTTIDIDPMINAFCLFFGPYVDKRTQEMCIAGEVSETAALSIAEVCQNFSLELGGLVSPASAWILLTKRHAFAEPEIIDLLSLSVMQFLVPQENAELERQDFVEPAVVGPDDRSDESLDEEDRHVTEVFLADPNIDLHEVRDAEPLPPPLQDDCET